MHFESRGNCGIHERHNATRNQESQTWHSRSKKHIGNFMREIHYVMITVRKDSVPESCIKTEKREEIISAPSINYLVEMIDAAIHQDLQVGGHLRADRPGRRTTPRNQTTRTP
jgi:hypothetical protein